MLSISARLLPSPTISNNPKSLTPTFSGRHHDNSTSILQLSGGSGLSLFLTDSRFSPIADLLSCGTCHSKTVLQTAAREFTYLISAKSRIHCIHHKYPAIPSASSAFLVPEPAVSRASVPSAHESGTDAARRQLAPHSVSQ